MPRIMFLPRDVVLFFPVGMETSTWFAKGLVDVDAYPELEAYCVDVEESLCEMD